MVFVFFFHSWFQSSCCLLNCCYVVSSTAVTAVGWVGCSEKNWVRAEKGWADCLFFGLKSWRSLVYDTGQDTSPNGRKSKISQLIHAQLHFVRRKVILEQKDSNNITNVSCRNSEVRKLQKKRNKRENNMEKTDPTTATKAISIVSSCASSSWLVARHRIHRTTGSDYSERSAAKDYIDDNDLLFLFFQMRSGRGKWDSNPGVPGNGYSSSEDDEMTRLKPNRWGEMLSVFVSVLGFFFLCMNFR